jgi:hypothetical protein
MSLKPTISLIPAYFREVFLRSKAALGGGIIIIAAGAVEHFVGRSLTVSQYIIVVLLAIVGAQFWHGLIQFKRSQPRIQIAAQVSQHFWQLDDGRGSTGTGYYFTVGNGSTLESLESVRAELVGMQPDEIGVLPAPLHIRHKDYRTVETHIGPGGHAQFDLVTGPDHNSSSQEALVIPLVMGGDRGYDCGRQVPYGRYKLSVRISAKNCVPADATFQIWVENDFLRCVAESAAFRGAER